MQILEGKSLAVDIQQRLRARVEALPAEQRKPHLAAVFVGDNTASAAYIRNKIRACEAAGFLSTLVKLDASTTQSELLAHIERLNADNAVDGFIVQLPLPAHIDEQAVTFAVSPSKDVDGFHPLNLGKMMLGVDCFLPATPLGILTMLRHYGIQTEGKNCVVVGRSNIVGTPISLLLSRPNASTGNATVTLVHSRTRNLDSLLQNADIVVAAIGKANFLRGEQLKKGCVVVDVGINSIADASTKTGSRLVGDVDFESASQVASAITPVPGGVGQMTVAALLLNTWRAYCLHTGSAFEAVI